jgi:Ca2+-binding RTX toxin-like protein
MVPVLLLLLALPGAARAATVSVEPYVEPPGVDPFESCSRYAMCPPDMLVFRAGGGESNQLTITDEASAYPRNRYLVRESGASVQVGNGCEQVDPLTIACTAGVVGPIRLGDGDDRFGARNGEVYGGPGSDALTVNNGVMNGDEGADVLVGVRGVGGEGDDTLMVVSGAGGSGDDELRCFPRDFNCNLDGGSGDDALTGATSYDRLFGRGGDDVLRGGAEFDTLVGGRGDDRLVGGAGGDHLKGGSGADRLKSLEDRSSVLDRVDCGPGRRDRALADPRDRVRRCERVGRLLASVDN